MSDYLVIFSSTSGFTEKYANWIAEELKCEAVRLRDLESAQLRSAKTIVYGGPVHAGWVVGLGKLLRRGDRQKNQDVYVFAVGLTPSNSIEIQRYRTANLNESNRKIPWFYFMGGLDIDKLKGPEKLVIKLMAKADAATKRKQALKAGAPLEELGNPLKQDYCDREAIKPLLEAIKAAA